MDRTGSTDREYRSANAMKSNSWDEFLQVEPVLSRPGMRALILGRVLEKNYKIATLGHS
jgi:hypothetical protein